MHSSLLISVLFVKVSVHKCMHLITNIQIHPNVGRAENSENGAADKSLTVPSSPLAPQSSNASSSQRIRHHRPSGRQINIYNIISKKSCEIHWDTRYEWFNDDNHELRWLHTCPNAGNKCDMSIHSENVVYIFFVTVLLATSPGHHDHHAIILRKGSKRLPKRKEHQRTSYLLAWKTWRNVRANRLPVALVLVHVQYMRLSNMHNRYMMIYVCNSNIWWLMKFYRGANSLCEAVREF